VGWLALEVSSFQCVDIDVAPKTVVVTSLGSDHLDWHGSLDIYRNDKLSLTRATGEHETWVPDVLLFRELDEAGELGGAVHFVATDTSDLAEALGLLGQHNHTNVALALAVVSSLTQQSPDELRARIVERAATFVPLPGRLTPRRARNGVGLYTALSSTTVWPPRPCRPSPPCTSFPTTPWP